MGKKNIKLSIDISEFENQMINYLLDIKNSKNRYKTYRKTNLIKDLIFNEFLKHYKNILTDLDVNTNDKYEVLDALIELGVLIENE